MPIGKAYPENPCSLELGSVKTYTDKEKEWQKEDVIKFQARLPKMLRRFVKVG